MEYITVREASEKWDMSVRSVQVLCKQGRIEGARKTNRSWEIPKDAIRPTDGRIVSGRYVNWRRNHRKSSELE